MMIQLQVALAGTQIWWTTEVNLAFARLEEGYENALKDYYKKQVRTCSVTSASPDSCLNSPKYVEQLYMYVYITH